MFINGRLAILKKLKCLKLNLIKERITCQKRLRQNVSMCSFRAIFSFDVVYFKRSDSRERRELGKRVKKRGETGERGARERF